jgi:hypothetical protein
MSIDDYIIHIKRPPKPVMLASSDPLFKEIPNIVRGDYYSDAPTMNHPIFSIWQDTIIPAVMSLVDAIQLPMHSVHLFQRVQSREAIDAGKEAWQSRLIISVGVGVQQATQAQGEDFVAKCGELLKSHSIKDVYVEVKESVFWR